MSEAEKRVVRDNVAKWHRDRARRTQVIERRKFNQSFNCLSDKLPKGNNETHRKMQRPGLHVRDNAAISIRSSQSGGQS